MKTRNKKHRKSVNQSAIWSVSYSLEGVNGGTYHNVFLSLDSHQTSLKPEVLDCISFMLYVLHNKTSETINIEQVKYMGECIS